MKIIGIPLVDRNTASTRIRFFGFLEHLPTQFSYEIYSGNLNCGVLYIQKVAGRDIIEVAKKAKSLSIPVVYDIDDDFDPTMDQIGMINLSSVTTVDTEKRAFYLKNYTKTLIQVVPDALDYVVDNEKPITVSDDLKCIVTFGCDSNLKYTAELYNCIPGNYTKSYICSTPNILNGRFIPWSLSSFLQSLKSFDVGLLVHPGDNKGGMKSNNRLLVCMSIGLPTIVSDTPAYSDTLKNINCEFLVAKNKTDIIEILRTLESKKIRQGISTKFHKYSWDNFAPELSSKILADIFNRVGGIKCTQKL